MRHLASMPPLSAGNKRTSVFRCEPCQTAKWIDDNVQVG
jgi:hypothetical protein